MNPLRQLLRRLAGGLRAAGGFSAAEETADLRRQTKTVLARLSPLDALNARVQKLRRENRDLRRQVARLEKITTALARRKDVEQIGLAVTQLSTVLPREVAALRRDSRAERRALERLQSQLLAVVRRVHLTDDILPYPYRLTARRFGALSQSGEDGLTLAILREMGAVDRRFVEIGCSDHAWNTGFLAEECGWSGLMVDANACSVAATGRRFPQSRVRAVVETVTPQNINDMFARHGVEGSVDVLSVDVDGNDYWLWNALTICRPRLVILEYNSAFGADRAVVVPYDPAHDWAAPAAQRLRYFGASLRAVQHLAISKGYRLVAVDPDSANAFCLRNDAAPHVPAIDAKELFRTQDKYFAAAVRSETDLFAVIEAEGLPLIDVADPAS
jgi:hypothetical protein